jgi:hypothetical protein
MSNYKIVVDCTTGKQEYVALTAAEIAERDQDLARWAEEQTAREAEAEALSALKESAMAKLMGGKPLTEEEAKAIVG